MNIQTTTNKDAIISLSGGMDSTTLLYYALAEGYNIIEAISFNYGQNHSKEIQMAEQICKNLNINHRVIDITFLKKLTENVSSLTSGKDNIPEGYYTEKIAASTVVPFRNGILLSIMAATADSLNCKTILYGAHAGDHFIYKDCRSEFADAMNKAIYLGTDNGISLLSPFINLTKSEICKIGLELKVPFVNTWSCYRGEDKPCLTCPTCVERIESFYDNNVKDPLIENEEIWNLAVKNMKYFKNRANK